MKAIKPETDVKTQSKAEPDRVLLEAEEVRKYFKVRGGTLFKRSGGWIRAVDGISFKIRQSETFSLVGESGCGKTTTAMLILLLEEPTSGAFYFQGENIHQLKGDSLKHYRAAVQAVFQDPWGSLNPRMRCGSIIQEPLKVNQRLSERERSERVEHILLQVGLYPWQARLFPHEFSGGQRQRVTIARALSVNPRLIILDEPVSSLDVSIQAQVMNLLQDLQGQYGMSYLLIAHNLGTVQYLSHRVAVMYLGKIVEEAPSEELFSKPLHPYTKALISAALPAKPVERGEQIVLEGEVPSPMNPPPGCRFHTRCPLTMKQCTSNQPAFQEVSTDHWISCHLY
jgi:oligopeptide/dipeptide ABC transporter ATP-binding protein